MKSACGKASLGTVAILAAATMLTAGIAAAQSVALSGNHPEVAPELATRLTSRADANRPLEIRLSFALRNRTELDKLLSDLQDPASPRYYHWLAPAEFDARFARTPDEIQAVIEWLKSSGFQNLHASVHEVTAHATVATAERAFATTIVSSPDGSVYANAADPWIPTRFAGVIGAIVGLDNTLHSQPASRLRAYPSLPAPPDATEPAPVANFNSVGYGFGPADIYTFYDETPLKNAGTNGGGGGGCIALAEVSDYLDSAVSDFDATFGLPAFTPKRVFPDRSSPGPTDAENEVLLDIEWAHAVAPGAPISVYIGKGSNGLTDAIGRAVTSNACDAISISYSFCGGPGTFYTSTLHAMFAQAASHGQSVFVASGDSGVDMCNEGRPNVNEMSADPNVTSVGGTEFVPDYNSFGNDVGNVPESAWNDSSGATGGGASRYFTKPKWQKGPGVPGDRKRDVPDIALGASPYSPGFYWDTDNGGSAQMTCCIGGTSIGAPMWAGLSKLIAQTTNRRLGNMNRRIYSLGTNQMPGLRDVTSGNNSFNGVPGFSAGPGYDQVTGWGSADMADLAAYYPEPVTLKMAPHTLKFPKTAVGTTSNPKTVKMSNPKGNKKHPARPVVIFDIQLYSDSKQFSETNNCPPTLAAGATCMITVTFTPNSATQQSGSVNVFDDGGYGALYGSAGTLLVGTGQ
jgi:subtilase family serine protease